MAPPTGAPSFGEETCMLAQRDRDMSRQTVESPPLMGLNPDPFSAPAAVPLVIRLEKPIPPLLFGAEVRYLLMSLQR